MEVHNHGTEEGEGLACRERKIGGRLIGACLAPDNVTYMDEWIERPPSNQRAIKRLNEISVEIMMLEAEQAHLEAMLKK